MHESPTVLLQLLRHSDAVTGMPVSLAIEPIARGALVALRWREAWATMQTGIFTLRNRPLGEAEAGFLGLIRNANREAQEEAHAWCAAHGFSAECV